MPHIHHLFNLCYENSYCSSYFKKSIMVMLQKLQKEDYTKAEAYCPVALLNILGKALKAIVAKKLNFLATTHTLLPISHMRGRKRISTDHKCHHLIKTVYAAWNSKKVASLLLLDVTGAFDNMNQVCLIHNLRKRQVDTKLFSGSTVFYMSAAPLSKQKSIARLLYPHLMAFSKALPSLKFSTFSITLIY